ncbi:hypothetical protein [Leptolyngbya sp. CCY15150]|uniref:hypothetical protein n=1 Tax=Leptolyngbya sp. CCY15150 TaxID=2767772 RepID=UPI0019520551|nr:hypothetical protein [Leptolyngbya sp. CCY15150]
MTFAPQFSSLSLLDMAHGGLELGVQSGQATDRGYPDVACRSPTFSLIGET